MTGMKDGLLVYPCLSFSNIQESKESRKMNPFWEVAAFIFLSFPLSLTQNQSLIIT